MSRVHVKSEKTIGARPEDVYAVLTNYKVLRPRILTPNFLDYTVEQGGQGAGTIIRYRLQAAGRERPYRLLVSEPLKGEVLVESDTVSSLATTWTLIPVNNGQQTRVRLTSEWQGAGGIGGFFERTFAPLGLRRIYNDILSSLAQTVPGTDTSSFSEQEPVNRGLLFAVIGVAVAVISGIVYILIQNQREQ